jgi:hypothetical protein
MNWPTNFLNAVENLCGDKVEWQLRGDDAYENITWISGTAPTKEAVQAELDKLVAAETATEYQRKRAAEYPAIGDQLDMIYKAGQGGDAFQAAIKAVKDKYPKPE